MSRGAGYGQKDKKLHITKTLQTEIQAMIAYACYDSDSICDSGVTMPKAKLVTKLYHLYMPPNNKNDDRLGMVKLFLSGSGQFKG